MRLLRRAAVVIICGLVAASPAAARHQYTSFSASVTAAPLSSLGRISVVAFASYHDWDCVDYSCDRNVLAHFELHRGFGPYGPLITQGDAVFGAYSSSKYFTFSVVPCRLLPKYQSITYTVTMDAVAPDGEERSGQAYATIRSCRF